MTKTVAGIYKKSHPQHAMDHNVGILSFVNGCGSIILAISLARQAGPPAE